MSIVRCDETSIIDRSVGDVFLTFRFLHLSRKSMLTVVSESPPCVAKIRNYYFGPPRKYFHSAPLDKKDPKTFFCRDFRLQPFHKKRDNNPQEPIEQINHHNTNKHQQHYQPTNQLTNNLSKITTNSHTNNNNNQQNNKTTITYIV